MNGDKLTRKELPQLTGAIGSMAQQQLEGRYVSRAKIEEFLDSPVPRVVPKALSYTVLNKELPFIRLGSAFFIFGICALLSFVSEGGIRDKNGSFAGFVFLSCWTAGSAAIVLGTVLYRRRKTRLLSEGVLTPGTITNVRMTGGQSTSGAPRYLTVAYESRNGPAEITYHCYRESEAIAREFMEQKKQVRMLMDPLDPKHVICPELMQSLDDALEQAVETGQRPYKYRPY